MLGPGGIGKTRLALEAATLQQAHFPHGVIFVSLAAVESAYAIIPLIAEALNFTFSTNGTAHQQLCDYLRHKTMLLVLDNFEQLLGDTTITKWPDPEEQNSAALVLELLQAAPQIKIMVTSRMQLRHNRAMQDKDELSLGLDVLSCLAIVESRYMDAQALVTEAIALHQEIGEQARLAHAQAFAGYVARGLGEYTLAQHYFFQALQSIDRHHGFLTLFFVLPGIALLLADDGEPERAIELYAQIADVPLVANSQMRWDLAGAHLVGVAATLPPTVVADAGARGKAGNLWTTAAALLVEFGRCGWGA